MNKNSLRQQAAYAALEAQMMPFSERYRSRLDQSFIKRLGKAAAGNLARPFVKVPTEILQGPTVYSLMGSGYENIVYASEEEVLKFNIRTLTDDELAAKQESVKRERLYEMCGDYLGGHWQDTSYGISPYLGKFAVVAKQPRIQAEATILGIEHMLDYSDEPDYIDELESLFVSIANLYQNTGYYPDILGKGNIVIIRDETDRPGLRVLDTEPASPEEQLKKIPNKQQVIGMEITRNLAIWGDFLNLSRQQSGSPEPVLR